MRESKREEREAERERERERKRQRERERERERDRSVCGAYNNSRQDKAGLMWIREDKGFGKERIRAGRESKSRCEVGWWLGLENMGETRSVTVCHGLSASRSATLSRITVCSWCQAV